MAASGRLERTPGASRPAPARATRRARRHLRRGRPLPARLTLTFRDPSGRKITESHRVKILPKRRP